MKISKSKQELARIIRENGGWCDGANIALFGKTSGICYMLKTDEWPEYETSIKGFYINARDVVSKFTAEPFANWHQTILSRDEYFHLYPVPDADGWIEWSGGKCPVGEDDLIDVKFSDGDSLFGVNSAWDWGDDADGCNVIAYRQHKPERAGATDKLSSDAVSAAKIALMSDSIEELVRKPTIEQLATDYRNLLDFARRKQQEADAAKADADKALRKLELAGEEIGLTVMPIAEKQEPELVITDWRDLLPGDEVEYVEGSQGWSIGMVGVVQRTDHDDGGNMNVRLLFGDKGSGWPRKWRFIRRP